MPSRQLSTADLTSARLAYEAGASYRQLGERYGVGHTTMRRLLSATGVASRPVGWPRRAVQRLERQQQAPVEIVQAATARLSIPMRSVTERRLRRWTEPEREAIRHEIAAGRVERVRRGRSGLPERRSVREATAAGIAFYRAMVRLKAA